MVNRDRGTEIATLRAELRKLPGDARVVAGGDRFNELQRMLDQRFALLRMTQARRVALAEEKAWALSEVDGYERGLVLAGGAGRFRQRLDERASVAVRITAEVEEVDRKIASIEAEIVASQTELVELLRRSVADSEEKVRRAQHVRRQRLARQWAALGEVDRLGMWSPVAVMGYRVWDWRGDGFHGVRQQWTHPRMVASCTVGGDIPHTDGRCAQVAYGCGIYASKSVMSLMNEVGLNFGGRRAIGLVGLEGRVVEHTRGYRAEIATVQALAIINRKDLFLIDDANRLAELFARPAAVCEMAPVLLPMRSSATATRSTIKTFLEQQARRNEIWISANPSA